MLGFTKPKGSLGSSILIFSEYIYKKKEEKRVKERKSSSRYSGA
jgi:hypothetical protein